jgi:hypothetical protein
MNIIKPIIGIVGLRDARRFEKSLKEPKKVQEQLLKEILTSGEDTVFGRDHHFREVSSAEDYSRKVPVVSYENLRPYIDRVVDGEKGILTREDPIFFATTSGTTGKPKFVPVTQSSRNAKSQVMRLWLYHASRAHPAMFSGKVLSVVSPEAESYTKKGIPCGAESGHAYRNMPSILKSAYAAPYEVFAIKDYELKYYILLRLALQEDVTFIGTCNPSTIMLLCQKMREFSGDIIRDIHDGTCRGMEKLSQPVREMIGQCCQKDVVRAKEIEKLSSDSGELIARRLWPNIALIGCWKGGSVGIYMRDFSKHFDEQIPTRDWGYLASEIRGSVPIDDEGSGGILTIETNYYEFVHDEEINEPKRRFLTVSDLEDGKRYYVFPTTIGGLYRYDMNDIIEVSGFYHRTPVIRFCQKGKGVSSLTGEKLYESQVIGAVEGALEKNRVNLEFIVMTVQMDDIPRYICIVEETESVIAKGQAEAIIRDIDLNLKQVNVEYETKRTSGRLGDPVLKIARSGEYEKYRKKRVAQGVPDGQFKMLKLNPDFEFQKNFAIDREFIKGD